MVLSLAFILAFIGAAVALLIGILIFSEVQGSMLATFPAPILISNGTSGGATATDNLYTCQTGSSGGGTVVHLSDKNGKAISFVTWNISGLSSVSGCHGLAQDPTDFQWYAIIKDSGVRNLASVDPTTGIGTLIGSTLDNTINSLVIKNDGTFWATNGAGNDQLLTINKSTGVATVECLIDGDNEEFNRLGYDYNTDTLIVTGEAGWSTGLYKIEVTEIGDTSGSSCGVTLHLNLFNDPNYNQEISGYNWCHSYAMTHHIGDDLFYTWSDSCQGSSHYFSSLDPNSSPVNYNAILINDSPNAFSNAPNHDLVTGGGSAGIGDTAGGMQFELTAGGGGSPPVFQSQVPDSFNTASNIAFTVIGILPVALFFVLFAIFGGRTE